MTARWSSRSASIVTASVMNGAIAMLGFVGGIAVTAGITTNGGPNSRKAVGAVRPPQLFLGSGVTSGSNHQLNV